MLLEMPSAVSNDSTACRVDGFVLISFACAGLLYSQVVNPPQAFECLQTDSASFRRPAQPSNSLASITGAAIQSIFQHLEVASAARLASTCKVCFDEHRHQRADIYKRAHHQLTPEVTFDFSCGNWYCTGVTIIVHWTDEELLLQMYRIAFHRKALQEFWSIVWPANLHKVIWTAAMKVGEYDRLANHCRHNTQIPFSAVWIHVVTRCTEYMSPLPDAWGIDGALDKAVMESLGSVCEQVCVWLLPMHQDVDGGLTYGQHLSHQVTTKDAHISANAPDDNDSDIDDPEIEWDFWIDWMHEVPSKQNSYAEQDQIFACEPIGQLRRREYTRRPSFVRSKQCRANRQADNRIKQPRKRLGKHGTGKHKRVGLVQWEMMLDHDMFV